GNLPRFLAAALGAADAQRIHIEVNAVIPEVETALDTGLSAQYKSRHRTTGGIAFRLQKFGDRRHLGVEVVAKVVPDSVLRREQTRKNRRVGDERERTVRVR